MADFITREFTVKSNGFIRERIMSEISNIFINSIRTIRDKHYDLTTEDIMADKKYNNQKDSLNFIEEFVNAQLIKNEIISYTVKKYNQLNVFCDRCGKTFIRLYNEYDLCDNCEKEFLKDAIKEDEINWYIKKFPKNQVEKDMETNIVFSEFTFTQTIQTTI